MNSNPKICDIPVLFITFARSDYARTTFNAIKSARPSTLYFYSNKARPDKIEETLQNNQIREFINEIDWECSLHTFFRDEYVDVYTSIWSAIDWIFESEYKAIILEEDCVPSLAFFDFCSQMLDEYENDIRLWVISGNNFISEYNPNEYDYIFSYFPFMYGWASWRDRWQKIIRTRIPLEKIKEYRLLDQIYVDPNAAKKALKFIEKIVDTPAWDYRFTISMKCNGGFGIIPKVNLVSNIGLSGEHNSGILNIFHERTLPDFDEYVIRHPPPFIVPDVGYSKYWYNAYYLKKKRDILKLMRRMFSMLRVTD